MKDHARARGLVPGLVSSAALAVFALGCGPRTVVVAVPPRIDLQPYNTIGVVEFASDPTDQLNPLTTQRFMAVIQDAQPSVRFLELGPAAPLLRSAGRQQIDRDTVKAIGRQHDVETLFTGAYEISGVKPKVVLAEDLTSVSASARVRISLTVRQWDTRTGATMWTRTRWGEWPVASLNRGTGQPISLSVSDPRDRYGDFLGQLVDAVTDDFRVRYERRPLTRQ